MGLLTHLLIISTFDLIFVGECRLVYINQNLTFIGAWTRCHEEYKGHLADVDKWTYSSQNLQSPCLEIGDFFWHGSLTKNFPWISFEDDGMGRFVFINKNLTYKAAWTRCHDNYKGKLANLDKLTYYSQSLQQSPCFEKADFFWHGSLIKIFPWIEFEGCFSYVHYSTAITMPYTSLTWCQNKCTNSGRSESYFGVRDSLCQCNVNITRVSPVKSKQCNIPCDDGAMCGGKGYISLYSRAPQSTFDLSEFESPENIDFQCLVYKCAQRTSVMVEAAKCTDLLPFVCENETGLFQETRREQWLTSNMFCTKMLTKPMCRNVKLFSDLKTWTSIFRVRGQFKDDASMKKNEMEKFTSSPFYMSDRYGEHILFPDGLKEYPSLCETDISDEQLYDEDRICDIMNGNERNQVSSTGSFVKTPVIIGASIVTLITVVGLIAVYCRMKDTRQQREVVNVEMEVGTSQSSRNISSRPAEADCSPTNSNVNAWDDDRRSITSNQSVYLFAGMTHSDRLDSNARGIPFVYSKTRDHRQNDVLIKGGVDSLYHEIDDSCIAEIKATTPPVINYMEDGSFTENGAGLSKSGTLKSEQSVYGETPEGVYDKANTSNMRRKRSGMENVYNDVYPET